MSGQHTLTSMQQMQQDPAIDPAIIQEMAEVDRGVGGADGGEGGGDGGGGGGGPGIGGGGSSVGTYLIIP
uniref:Uncharacterized protein n=1 Tax=Arcella intermedia TaxID=1963864 RepID=A0A6B2LXG0_9EUKA